MSFNIRGGLGMDGRRSTERIAGAIRDLTPDVVCFQEVHQRLPWSGWVDQPRRLRRALEMPILFLPCLRVGVGGYGIAIGTRLPLRSSRQHFLPSVGEQRGALEVSAQTQSGPLSVWCTHWGLRPEERERQAAAMAGWVAGAREPVLVCGDFNERAGAPAVTLLRSASGLRDVGAESDLPTYPAERPTARIDLILASPGLTPRNCYVLDTIVSDHRPVVADFG